MPFDQFTIEQLAGDLLPSPATEQIIATAFHRNTMQNDEGGVSDEEYRVAAVIDRVNTTMQVWMGVTMGCCQCHTHKYDPLTHREYYELLAFFNQTADADRYDQEPTLLTPTKRQRQLQEELDRALAESERQREELVKSLAPVQREWEAAVAAEVDWKVIVPSEVATKSGARFQINEDGAVVVSGEVADSDAYIVRAKTDLRKITALRLEALEHPSLPANGPGRAADGGFALSKVTLQVEPVRPAENVKFVRIELPRHDYLKMAEVEVFRGEVNVARSAFERTLARPPAAAELETLVRLYESELQHYRGSADAAVKMATSELGPPETEADMAELAAWTVVANVLLNLDETLSK